MRSTRGLARRGLMLAGAMGLALAGWPVGLEAQRLGSRLLETGHWAYEYLGLLQGAGYLPGLDLLAQPLTRGEVAQALQGLSPDSLREPQASWVRLLREEFESETAAPSGGQFRAGAVALAGVRAATTQRLDALRALDAGGDTWPRAEGGGWVQGGVFVAEARVLFDTYLGHDPDGRTPSLPWGGITDHTYASLSWNPGGVVLGRVARNWAPAGTRGLLLSDNPLSYPQLGVNLRVGRFDLQGFTAQLDTLGGTRRFLAANRVAYAAPHLTVAVTEALLYSSSASGLSLQLLDPFTPLLFETENPPDEDRSGNLMLGAHLWYGRPHWEVYVEGLLDDIDISPDSPLTKRAPTRYGVTVSVRVRPFGPAVQASLEYQQVSSYAYRTYRLPSRYDFFGRGLGENFADYDRLTASLHLFPPVRGLRLSPTFALLRQGEGDFRVPFPDETTFRYSPSLFLGVVERTYRFALQGRYQPLRQLWLAWDLGQNTLRNADHVVGRDASRFAALGEVGVRLDLPGGRR